MTGPILYVTGTNTGVGKTFLAKLILQAQREQKLGVAAMKPFCSGGRDDAIALHALQTAGLTLDEVNPFHFDEPITPLQAARNVGRKITLSETLEALDVIRASSNGAPLLVEGAGGLLSPLGEGFSLLDIIERRPGRVCIVASNVLGTINLARLTSLQLGISPQEQAIALMNTAQPDESTTSNYSLLVELLPRVQIVAIPYFKGATETTSVAPLLRLLNATG